MGYTNKGSIGDKIKLTVDEDGHRTYTVPFLVQCTPGVDGPNGARLLIAQQVPTGSTWGELFPGDADECAWCRPTLDVSAHPQTREGTAPEFWIVTRTFSTKFQRDGGDRCNDTEVCDPLDEPQKIRVSYSTFTEEASCDRFGRRILSSSHEPIHGPNNEWEFTKTTILITQNVDDPQLTLIEQMKDSVNATTLWGFPPRTIRFRPVGDADRKWRMVNNPAGTGSSPVCRVFWTRQLSFEIKFRRRLGVGSSSSTGTAIELTPIPQGPYETWDRDVWDEGTRVLRGYWSDAGSAVGTGTHFSTHWTLSLINGLPPDPNNPQHFIRFKDWNGENSRTLLDGEGKPAFVPYITSKWWVVKIRYPLGSGRLDDTNLLFLPCPAALRYANNVDLDIGAENDMSITLHGPFSSQTDAEGAIETYNQDPNNSTALGDPITTCQGIAATSPAGAGVVHIEKYPSADFLLLGIPTDFTVPLAPFTNP